LAGRYLTTGPEKLAHAIRHLEPLVMERRQRVAESGRDYPNKPNDLLEWLLDGDRGAHASVREVTHRIFTLNFAAVHTMSNVRSLTFFPLCCTLMDVRGDQACGQSLFTLAVNPQYVAELREELEVVIAKHGWSKAGMAELVKLDSFIKECTCFWLFQACTSHRCHPALMS
jgi:hypothetical protein